MNVLVACEESQAVTIALNVLVACEESQEVCKAFRKRGHRAFSCDIQECSGGHPEWHIMQDVLPLLNGNCEFTLQNGEVENQVGRWDLIIAHPPCTYLTKAGASNIPRDPSRIEKGHEAAEFFMKIWNADCDKIAVENPIPMKRFGLPKYNQIFRPWMVGVANNKPICFWLKNLPLLQATNPIEDHCGEMVRWTYKKTGQAKSCSKWYNTGTSNHRVNRSKTFPEVAEAIADQWTK